MDSKDDETMDKLIDELKINDAIKAEDYENLPEVPKQAIEELIKIGRDAVEPLMALLKDKTRMSCFYSLKALAEIKDPQAVKPILDVIFSKEYDEIFQFQEEHDQPILALQKIGLPTLEPTLRYIREHAYKEKLDIEELNAITNAFTVLEGIKHEKSLAMLTDMLSHPYTEVREQAVESLGKYGDRRAVDHLKKLLEDEEWVDYTLGSIRKLVPFKDYQKIVDPYAPKYIEEQREKINRSLRELENAHEYPPNFEGDDAEEFKAIARELKLLENVESILSDALALAECEGVISEKEYWQSRKIASKLWRIRWKLESENEEEKTIIEGYIPGPVLTKETRSYRGLTTVSWTAEHPRLEILRSTILNWLKKQHFRIIRKYSSIYARKGRPKKRKGFYAATAKDLDSSRRTWGIVSHMIWGEGWARDEAETFKSSFLELIDNTVKQLVDKKKYEMQIIEG